MSGTTLQPTAEQEVGDKRRERTSSRRKFKRTQYFVARRAQLRMTVELVVLWLVGAFLAATNLFVLHKLGDLYWTGTLQSEHSTSVDNIVVWTYSVISLIIAVVVFLLACIYYSHRIAGPARKITQSLDEIADGDLRIRVKLRKTDHLKEVAEALNGVTLSWGNTMSKIDRSTQSIKAALEAGETDELREHCAAIEEALLRFKFRGD